MDRDWWLRVEMPSTAEVPGPPPAARSNGILSNWIFDITRDLLFSFSVVIMSCVLFFRENH